MTEKDIVKTQGVEGQAVAEPENNTVPSSETRGIKTEKNAYFAHQRRKQQIEQMRADNAKLKQQLEEAGKASPAESEADSRISQLESQLQIYRDRENQRMLEDDLRAVQSVDPTVTSLDDLPDVYTALRFNKAMPLGAREAFVAARAILQQTKQPKPASAGSISGSGGEREFYTSEELDSLTSKMLDDSKIMEKALRSMARLTKERG